MDDRHLYMTIYMCMYTCMLDEPPGAGCALPASILVHAHAVCMQPGNQAVRQSDSQVQSGHRTPAAGGSIVAGNKTRGVRRAGN
jgi:hypothetical protein